MEYVIIEQVTVKADENFTQKTIQSNKKYGELVELNGTSWIVVKEA